MNESLGRGYNYKEMKSNNAIDCENDLTHIRLSKLAKLLKSTQKNVLQKCNIEATEWHHEQDGVSDYSKKKWIDLVVLDFYGFSKNEIKKLKALLLIIAYQEANEKIKYEKIKYDLIIDNLTGRNEEAKKKTRLNIEKNIISVNEAIKNKELRKQENQLKKQNELELFNASKDLIIEKINSMIKEIEKMRIEMNNRNYANKKINKLKSNLTKINTNLEHHEIKNFLVLI